MSRVEWFWLAIFILALGVPVVGLLVERVKSDRRSERRLEQWAVEISEKHKQQVLKSIQQIDNRPNYFKD